MKKLAIVSLLFVFGMFFSLHVFGENKENESTKALQDILAVMEKHDVTLENWSLYSREHGKVFSSKRDAEQWLDNQKKRYHDFTWTVDTANSQGYKATATRGNSIKEEIIFILHGQKNKFSSYVIYKISGPTWNEQVNNVVKERIVSRSKQLFVGTPHIFTCIKGQASDKMDKTIVKKAYSLVNDFQASKVEEIKEENFVSVSAHSNLWQASIMTGNKEMNLQIALRNEGLGGKTTVVIGTPIITIEY
jgi:hypothetical protein